MALWVKLQSTYNKVQTTHYTQKQQLQTKRQLMQYLCLIPWIKSESLHVNHILIV